MDTGHLFIYLEVFGGSSNLWSPIIVSLQIQVPSENVIRDTVM